MIDREGKRMQTAVLGGGCFWCLDAVFRRLRGVNNLTCGYAGGSRPDPSYEYVCSGVSGHAEVVRIEYDPAEISYAQLLEIFFACHDPTTIDRQGHDIGSQYRSIIFCQDEEQKSMARQTIENLTAAAVWSAPIVTELSDNQPFYPAEGYHQDYFARHPAKPYCAAVIAPKVMHLRQQFADVLAG